MHFGEAGLRSAEHLFHRPICRRTPLRTPMEARKDSSGTKRHEQRSGPPLGSPTYMLTRLLRTYLRRYKAVLAGVVGLQFVQTVAALFLPRLFADIIDKGVAKGNNRYVWTTASVMLVIAVVTTIYSQPTAPTPPSTTPSSPTPLFRTSRPPSKSCFPVGRGGAAPGCWRTFWSGLIRVNEQSQFTSARTAGEFRLYVNPEGLKQNWSLSRSMRSACPVQLPITRFRLPPARSRLRVQSVIGAAAASAMPAAARAGRALTKRWWPTVDHPSPSVIAIMPAHQRSCATTVARPSIWRTPKPTSAREGGWRRGHR